MTLAYPRDLIGYGRKPPHPQWPNNARLALQFVLNHEEGAENCVLHGDPASETFLSEIIGAQAFPMRHMSMESIYEYGSRAGLWRVLRTFEQRRLPLTIFAVAMALRRHREAAAAFQELGHEIACHGLRWISYQQVDEETERAHLREAVEIIREITGSAPLGWYTGRDSPNTRRLVVEHGGFVYDSDSYADDLPYWSKVRVEHHGRPRFVPHLVVPYTLDTNDMRFAAAQGFNECAQDAVDRAAQPPDRTACPDRRAGALSRLRDETRRRVDLPTHRHCRPLDRHVPGTPKMMSLA
jgi:peptidoglycan/xylan/chitin deacetylase (PgdA/CDA1 family)